MNKMGYRGLILCIGEEVTVAVERSGPPVVDVKQAVRAAAAVGFFHDKNVG